MRLASNERQRLAEISARIDAEMTELITQAQARKVAALIAERGEILRRAKNGGINGDASAC